VARLQVQTYFPLTVHVMYIQRIVRPIEIVRVKSFFVDLARFVETIAAQLVEAELRRPRQH